jgi:hypothetical protein
MLLDVDLLADRRFALAAIVARSQLQSKQATAFSILLLAEASMPSGFFLKKKPPCKTYRGQDVNRKRSRDSVK